jgi:glycosyltransferase involved in cell wall biosynthesis
MPTNLIYIDYGSRGISGLLSRNFCDSLSSDCKLYAFLHMQFKFSAKSYKIYRIFGMSDYLPLSKKWLRILKLPELFFSFVIVYIFVLTKFVFSKNKPIVIINIYQSISLYGFLSIAINRFSKVFFVIHDAIPHKNSIPKFLTTTYTSLASNSTGIICFGEESKDILSDKIKNKPIYAFLFPPFFKNESRKSAGKKIGPVKEILFIGNVREDKNLFKLLEVWRVFCEKNKTHNISLKIKGFMENDLIDKLPLLKSVHYTPRYLSDSEFEESIDSADFLILPYKGVTNSGILHNAISVNKPCIVSSDPLFLDSVFNKGFLVFNCFEELEGLLWSVNKMNEKEYEALVGEIENGKKNYFKLFEKSLDFFKERYY